MTYRKNLLLVTLLSLALVVVSGCGGGDTPSKTVEKFFTAVDKGDSATVDQVIGPGAGSMLTSPFGKMAVMKDGMPKSYTHTINGNNATVTVTYGNGQTENFPLEKVDGKWLVRLRPPGR